MTTATVELSLTASQILDLIMQLPAKEQASLISSVLETEQTDDCPVTDATIQVLRDWELI